MTTVNKTGKVEGLIRPAKETDMEAISSIYNHFICHSTATFEEIPVQPADMLERYRKIIQSGYPYLVYESNGEVCGYAYGAQWKVRSAYRYSAETTIYLSQSAHGKGIGTQLYQSLLDKIKDKGIHIAVACLALPNPGSEALHKKLNFQFCGAIKEAGLKFDTWVDVGYFQLQLND